MMTDVEAWTLLNAFNNSGMNAMALYLTVASGYPIVAYLAEKILTTHEVVLISVMFVIFSLLFTYGGMVFFSRASFFATQINEYTESAFRQRPVLSMVVGTVQFFGVVSCLVFMWQVRHSNTE